MRRRAVTTALATSIAASTLGLNGCSRPTTGGAARQGTSTGSASSGEVEFWDTNAVPRLTREWRRLIDRFQARTPDVRIRYTGLPVSSYLRTVDDALATGRTPDLLLIGGEVAHLIHRRALAPVDRALADSGLDARLDPAMLDSERLNSPDGRLYKVPLTALSDVIWYRTDWLRDAGLPDPTSYDDLFAAARALTDPARGRYGWSFRGGSGSIPPLFGMTYGMAGVSRFFTPEGRATFDDPRVVAALERYLSLYRSAADPADLDNDYPRIVAALDGARAWATHHNLGSYQDHRAALGDRVRGVQPFPGDDGSVTAVGPALSGLVVFRTSPRKDAAFRFVEFLATEANAEWAHEVGQVPANRAAAGEPWVRDAQPLRDVVALSSDPDTRYLALPTYLPDWASILHTEMEPDLRSVLRGGTTARAFARTYAARFERALRDYRLPATPRASPR